MERDGKVWRLLGTKQISLSSLEKMLRIIVKIIGFAPPVKPYYFCRAAGEALNISSRLSNLLIAG